MDEDTVKEILLKSLKHIKQYHDVTEEKHDTVVACVNGAIAIANGIAH